MTAIPLTVLPMPGFPPTVKPISIPDSWRFLGRKGLKSGTKTNTCWIREVSAICVYGLHHSTIYGIMQPVHGFVWPFVVWLHIVRFREMQRFVLCTEYRIMPPKTARNEKSPVSRSIRSTGLGLPAGKLHKTPVAICRLKAAIFVFDVVNCHYHDLL